MLAQRRSHLRVPIGDEGVGGWVVYIPPSLVKGCRSGTYRTQPKLLQSPGGVP